MSQNLTPTPKEIVLWVCPPADLSMIRGRLCYQITKAKVQPPSKAHLISHHLLSDITTALLGLLEGVSPFLGVHGTGH